MKKPVLELASCPYCDSDAVGLFADHIAVTWCEKGHVCTVEPSLGYKLVFDFTKPE